MTTKMREKFTAILKDLSPDKMRVAFDFVEFLKEKDVTWRVSPEKIAAGQQKSLKADLLEALEEYKDGHYYGPFETAEKGIKFLRSRRMRKTK